MKIRYYLVLFLFLGIYLNSSSQSFGDFKYPFSTNTEQLTVWNGTEYLPFFIKGVNLGIAVPGTYPGELDVSRAQYVRWFGQIKDAGFNVIRLYTLHYPHFYEALDSFNLANPTNPLFFMQGVWLNEEVDFYNQDLYMLNDQFNLEITDNINCVHGNIVIPPRYGKAFGDFHTDVSQWCMAYMIGREVDPFEIITTNDSHPEVTSFYGAHFAIENATASEAWYTEKLNRTVQYEHQNYNTQRPVSMSSWPTLDPMRHPEEIFPDEDTAFVDMTKIQFVSAPAGFFISYHAYPYYPDFVSWEEQYLYYYDNYGSNSYLGYLTDLKSHYQNLPLIIAEYGVPSSWGVAHYASSGMNHGGFDEHGQGETDIRLLKTIEEANCGGGIQFAWMDEWFKRTWVTDHIDFPAARRILWQNVTAAEQNFGLVSFEKESVLERIGSFGNNQRVQSIDAGSNYKFFELDIALEQPLDITDVMWVALDTYFPDLGESVLPNGFQLPYRSEFAIEIRNYSATLYVTEAYDLFGIFHGISSPAQKYRSTVTDGAPWEVVRWKNNETHSSVQYIGALQLNHGSEAESSMDAVTIYDDHITVRLPWTLMNFISPSDLKVFHDDRDTWPIEEMETDGIAVTVQYKDQIYASSSRYIWEPWDVYGVRLDPDLNENLKTSYWVMKDRLTEFNSKAVALLDSLYLEGPDFPISISAAEGVMSNDFDLDGNFLMALLIEPPLHGNVNLNLDGSFSYMPRTGFNGYDTFYYCLFDGYSLSEQNKVVLEVSGNASDVEEIGNSNEKQVRLFPNPANDYVEVEASTSINQMTIFDMSGRKIKTFTEVSNNTRFDISDLAEGEYIVLFHLPKKLLSQKINISR